MKTRLASINAGAIPKSQCQRRGTAESSRQDILQVVLSSFTAQLRSKAGSLWLHQKSFVNCQSFEMYMLHCRNSQVWLDYSSNGRRNCSSHCSSCGQSSMILIDGNMTWFMIAQRKAPWNEKGERPADFLLLNKPVGQIRMLGCSQFSTIWTASLISYAVTVFNFVLALSWWLLCLILSFLPELAKVLPQVQLNFVLEQCWKEHSPLT